MNTVASFPASSVGMYTCDVSDMRSHAGAWERVKSVSIRVYLWQKT